MIVSRWCVLIVVGLAWWGPVQAQDSSQDRDPVAPASGPVGASLVQRVEASFRAGDPELLLSPAAERIEISRFGTRTFYSRSQAFYVLEDFFKEYGPRDFQARDVTEAGTNTFVTGLYWHVRAERPFRVYVRLSESSDDWHLQEVRIEPTRE